MKLPFLFAFAFLHFIVAVCCLLTAISIAVLGGKLTVQCGLYIEVQKNDGGFLYTSSLSYSTCQYLKIMPGINFVVSLVLMIYHLYPAISRLRRNEARYDITEIICWCITIVTGMLLFVASCIISTGFRKSCVQIRTVAEYYKSWSCRKMFDNTKFAHNPTDASIYIFLSLAEIACWTAFLGTAVAVSLSSFLIFKNRRKGTRS